MKWFRELAHPDFAQSFRYQERLYRGASAHQIIEVYGTSLFGRVLVLDGAVQLTQLDNHIYHELLAHVPLLAHGCAADVLIIGGGDGGALREVLKHPVKRVTLVELDPLVMDVSRTYFPELAQDVFEDPRIEIVLDDGNLFVRHCDRKFDVVIIDSTDPTGPGGALFTSVFYDSCRKIMRKDGVIVLQAGAPAAQDALGLAAAEAFEAVFGTADEYIATVPSYPMGMVVLRGRALGGGSLKVDQQTLERRFKQCKLHTRHYTPSVHASAFGIFPLASRLSCTLRVPVAL